MSCAMLIPSPRHSKRDLEDWKRHVRRDEAVCKITPWEKREGQAMSELHRFKPDYVSVSWGKDSTVLAHLVWRLVQEGWECPPVIWFRVEPIYNPDCLLVRDEFLKRFPLNYHEIKSIRLSEKPGECPSRTDSSAPAIQRVREEFGPRYAGGVRAEESSTRSMRFGRHGLSTKNTCQPIGYWTTAEVFAYLYKYDLPIHPAYACTQGGVWERNRLRVGSLGLSRGRGMGRLEWELYYYGQEMYEWGFRQ